MGTFPRLVKQSITGESKQSKIRRNGRKQRRDREHWERKRHRIKTSALWWRCDSRHSHDHINQLRTNRIWGFDNTVVPKLLLLVRDFSNVTKHPDFRSPKVFATVFRGRLFLVSVLLQLFEMNRVKFYMLNEVSEMRGHHGQVSRKWEKLCWRRASMDGLFSSSVSVSTPSSFLVYSSLQLLFFLSVSRLGL